MNTELIPVVSAVIGGEPVSAANARELWKFLESKRQFSNWIKDRIRDYRFVEDQDFTVNKIVNGHRGRFAPIDYFITLDMAKELAMVENNERGRAARRYFIEVEKEFRRVCQPEALPATPAEKRPLIETVVEMLNTLNRRITEGEDIPPHILKYAWNVASTSRDVLLKKYLLPVRRCNGASDAELVGRIREKLQSMILATVPLPGRAQLSPENDQVFLRSSAVRQAFTEWLHPTRDIIGVIRSYATTGDLPEISEKISIWPHRQTELKRRNGILWNPSGRTVHEVRVLDLVNGRLLEIDREPGEVIRQL